MHLDWPGTGHAILSYFLLACYWSLLENSGCLTWVVYAMFFSFYLPYCFVPVNPLLPPTPHPFNFFLLFTFYISIVPMGFLPWEIPVISLRNHHHYHHHLPLDCEDHWAPQMILQPVFSIFPCFPLPSRTCRTPGLSIPWCCLPTSSSVCLVFFPFSLCLAWWFWPNLMNGEHDHTIAVCVSLRSSGGLCVVQLPAGSWHRLPRW